MQFVVDHQATLHIVGDVLRLIHLKVIGVDHHLLTTAGISRTTRADLSHHLCANTTVGPHGLHVSGLTLQLIVTAGVTGPTLLMTAVLADVTGPTLLTIAITVGVTSPTLQKIAIIEEATSAPPPAAFHRGQGGALGGTRLVSLPCQERATLPAFLLGQKGAQGGATPLVFHLDR